MADDDQGHVEIQELLGAYALDAVDDRERATIEAHLETCESCRAELEDHRRLAQTLRRHAVRVSPLASSESNGVHRTNGEVGPKGPIPPWGVPLALAIVLLLVVGMLITDQVRFGHLESAVANNDLLQRAQLATVGPEAVLTALRTPGNEPVLTVVSLPAGGIGYAINSTLRPLGDDGTYQLWSAANGTVTATVALGRRPDVVTFTLPAGVTEFVVTAEHKPVPARPTFPAVATGQVSQGH